MIATMAKVARCQSPYISRVLLGKAQLSLEQAHALQKLLGHARSEAAYFMLLVEWERAGNSELKAFFAEQLESARQARSDLRQRLLKPDELPPDLQRTYYSSYHYAAVHTCISIPALQTLQALQDFLRLPRERLLEVLGFLTETGILLSEGSRWKVGTARLHLGRDSTLIRQHHANWRIEAIKSLDRGDGAQSRDELHYSGVVSLSHADAIRLKELWVHTLEQFSREVAPSVEETVRAIVIDFFALG